MGIQHRVVRHGNYSEHRTDNQTSINDFRSSHSVRRHIQHTAKKHIPGKYQEHPHRQCYHKMHDHTYIEDTPLLFLIPFALGIVHEALSGTCH